MPADFRSDNVLGCSPEILEAIARESRGTASSYGDDPVTKRVRARCGEIFETEVEIFPVVTGTAGNALAIASIAPTAGTVFCHEHAHIERDEFGASEFFSDGAKLVTIPGTDGKLHEIPFPGCLSLTNATEAGTVYSPSEIGALAARAERVHMDGARFANALVTTGAAPADLTWRAGVDILTLGATKNGALAAELIIVFRKEIGEQVALRQRRAGHRLSKMRFVSAQLDAYFADDLWLRNARHANAMARRLAQGLEAGGVEIVRRVQANLIFARFPRETAERLTAQEFLFYQWPLYGPDVYRLITGFNTRPEDVDAFVGAACDIKALPSLPR